MAHPKRKISKTRRDKRRTHYKADNQTIKICQETGEAHLYHHAHEHEGKLYYRGKLVSEKAPKQIFVVLKITNLKSIHENWN